MPFRATIGSTDVSAYLKGVSFEPGGDGVVGSGSLYLTQEAGGLDIRTMMDVKVWQTYNDAGAGIASRGRLLGGLVSARDTGNVGTTKLWQLTCYDYNVLLHLLVRDAAGASAITLTAGTFTAQVAALTAALQYNGYAAVAQEIDATSYVANLHATMPAVTLEGGHPYGWYIEALCLKVRELAPTVVPAYFMGVERTFGVGDVFGGPVLEVYDAALTPLSVVDFSDTPTGAEKAVFGQFRRITDATAMTQRRQSIWGDLAIVLTSKNDTSQTTYPNPYMNHGQFANKGYWMAEANQDSQSATYAEAQAALDQSIQESAYPVDTYEWETPERVLPGEYVGLKWDLESIATGTVMRVARVSSTIESPDTIWSRLTVNNRRLGLLDDGRKSVFAPPIEGDTIPPLAPTNLAVGTPTYDPLTNEAILPLTWTVSASPDAIGYRIYRLHGIAYRWIDVGNVTAYNYRIEQGASYSLHVCAYDRRGNVSPPSNVVTGTAPVRPAAPLAPTITSVTGGIDRVGPYALVTVTWSPPTPDAVSGGSVYATRGMSRVTPIPRGSTSPHVALVRDISVGVSYDYTADVEDQYGQVSPGSSPAVAYTIPQSPQHDDSWGGITQDVEDGLGGWAIEARTDTTCTLEISDTYQYFGQKTLKLTVPLGKTLTVLGPPFPVFALAPVASLDAVRLGVTVISAVSRSEWISFRDKDDAQTEAQVAITDSLNSTTWKVTHAIVIPASSTSVAARRRIQLTANASDIVAYFMPPITTRAPQVAGMYLDLAQSNAIGVGLPLYGDQSGANVGFLQYTSGVLSLVPGANIPLKLVGAQHRSRTAQTSGFTADANHEEYDCSHATGFTAALPDATTCEGRTYIFKNTSVGTITIDPYSTQTIDGASTYALSTQWQAVTIRSNGANWLIIGKV